MGYGAGAFLLVAGLVLALAVEAEVSGVDVQLVGWILVAVGVLVLALAAFTWGPRRHRSVATVTHPDGSQTVQEQRGTI